MFCSLALASAKFGDIEIEGTTAEQPHRCATTCRGPGLAYAARRFGRGASITTPRSPGRRNTCRPGCKRRRQLGAEVKLAGAEYHADTNRADIHFAVKPGPVSTVTIEGAHLWSWTRKALLPVYQGVGVDEESVEEGRQALISYFQAKGYFDAKVDAQLQDRTNRLSVHRYGVTKEKKHKVAAVELAGNEQLPSSELTPHLTVREGTCFRQESSAINFCAPASRVLRRYISRRASAACR